MKIHPPPSLSSHLISSLTAILSGDYRWKAMLEAHGVKVKNSRALNNEHALKLLNASYTIQHSVLASC